MKNKFKKGQYEDRIRDIVNQYFRSNSNNGHFKLITCTKASLNNDFSQAKIYWDSFDPELKKSGQKLLRKAQGSIRSFLAQEMKVRHTPEVVFFADTQFEDEGHIVNLLSEESKQGRFQR